MQNKTFSVINHKYKTDEKSERKITSDRVC